MLKAIIFDFDGTIIDTETAWYEAFREAYLEHGVELRLDMYAACIGTSLHAFNPYEYLMTELGMPIDKAQFRQSVHDRHARRMEKEAVRDGIFDYLASAKAAGLKIGLASSSRGEWVSKHLKLLGIEDDFECIRTADHVRNVKPDPELYIRTLACLGVHPSEAVAIEDSPNGANAAFAAGMHCVVIPNAITKHLAFGGEPLYTGASLSELEFERLLKLPAAL